MLVHAGESVNMQEKLGRVPKFSEPPLDFQIGVMSPAPPPQAFDAHGDVHQRPSTFLASVMLSQFRTPSPRYFLQTYADADFPAAWACCFSVGTDRCEHVTHLAAFCCSACIVTLTSFALRAG